MTITSGVRRYGSLAAVLASTTAVVVGLCGPASAATGGFGYRDLNVEGLTRALIDPPAGKCIPLLAPARQMDNQTDVVVQLFSNATCGSRISVLQPDTTTTTGPLVAAVVFNG
ncbi:hypothetical protein [Nocardia sp. XZ_19_231]|uniref:hypothetical protein n=1 Tax=Nocardia sp. XZ_19_231 TaxID=2769252 RepID=UPI0018908F88|nr:hypothetical protein [Nocardia sp. XZ_19_231]